jgi:parvulin-like peptidyl-prolyl isomerase
MKKILSLSLILLSLSSPAAASEIVFQFKNPSFSGVNTGAQWLTIENQERSRVKEIQDKIEADLKAKALEEKNSILNRFMNNLQSRIYSQLAQQLTQNLFANGDSAGSFDLDGNTIAYEQTLNTVKLTITDENNNVTVIEIPIGQFKF